MKTKYTFLFLLLVFASTVIFAQGGRSIETLGIDDINIIELVGKDAWVGTVDSGLWFYNDSLGSWTSYNTTNEPGSFKSDSIKSIYAGIVAGTRHAYIGTTNGIAYNLEGQWKPLTAAAGEKVVGTAVRNDSVWALADDGILLFQDSTYKTSLAPLRTPIVCGQKHGLGQVCAGFWAGTRDSGAFYTTDGINSARYLDTSGPNQHLIDNRVNVIRMDNNCGAVIVGTKGGLSRCPMAGAPLPPCQRWTISDGLPQNDIVDLAEDCKGNLWIATRDSGVVIFANNAFTKVTGLPNNKITAIALNTECQAWLGSNDGKIAIMDSLRTLVKVLTGVNTINRESVAVNVYPIPASDQVNFVFDKQIEQGTAMLTDMSGRTVGQVILNNTSHFTIDISALATGLYLYQISSPSQILKTGKLQVVK